MGLNCPFKTKPHQNTWHDNRGQLITIYHCWENSFSHSYCEDCSWAGKEQLRRRGRGALGHNCPCKSKSHLNLASNWLHYITVMMEVSSPPFSKGRLAEQNKMHLKTYLKGKENVIVWYGKNNNIDGKWVYVGRKFYTSHAMSWTVLTTQLSKSRRVVLRTWEFSESLSEASHEKSSNRWHLSIIQLVYMPSSVCVHRKG